MTIPVALLFVAAVALRGYVPGAEPRPREPAAQNPFVLAAVAGLLMAAVAVVAVAVIVRLRNRSATPPRVAGRSDWLRRDERGRLTWRIGLIAAGLILGWLLLSALLSRFGGGRWGDTSGPGAVPDTADTAPDAGGSAAPAATLAPEPGSNVLGYFYAATAVFLVVLVVGTIIAARRQRRPQPLDPADTGADDDDAGTGSQSLARAAEVGLAEVGDLSREPRKAIIACYAAMERQLSLLPDAAPREFDTATEVLARAVDHHALAPNSATQLVDLFEEARFSPHVMNEGHRDAAVAVLTQVLDELRSSV